MGYRHIDNLYKNTSILMFKECFALEKIHGTSANVRWGDGKVWFHSGGEKHDRFLGLFDETELSKRFECIGHPSVTVFGEAYGGKQQAQSWRYGKELRFVAFEVKIGDTWLGVEQAHDVATKLGLEFVHYRKIPTDLDSIDTERDAPSEQARRNGIEEDKPREGVVLRPLIEVRLNNGDRVIAKHKRDEERETKSKRVVGANVEVLKAAQSIADEWVTPTRLEHVLDKLPPDLGIEDTREVIAAMTSDVLREGEGEFVDSREARSAIGRATAYLFKQHLKKRLTEVGL